MGSMGSLLRQLNSAERKQDYIVLPDQVWLDGIATSPGIVKQFVATEMAPPRRDTPVKGKHSRSPSHRDSKGRRTHHSEPKDPEPVGSSIEWQMTGRDEVGGLQLQIIPEFDTRRMHAGSMRNVCKDWVHTDLTSCVTPTPEDAIGYDVLKTPEELGLKAGDMIHAKRVKDIQPTRDKVIGDLLVEHLSGPLTSQNVVELTVVAKDVRERVIRVSLLSKVDSPIQFKVCTISSISVSTEHILINGAIVRP